jgi:hypothetical protein
LNWGSRNASLFCTTGNALNGNTTPISTTRNPSYFVDYQDCKFIGHPKYYNHRPVALCSGVATIGSGNSSYNLGGIALVDLQTMVPLSEVPIALTSRLGQRMTQNPVEVNFVDGKLRMYWAPDQHNTTIYVYSAEPMSPFEYGGTGGSGHSFQIYQS